MASAGYRDHLKPCGEAGIDREGQQQVLRVYFAGIHHSVRKLLSAQVARLSYRPGKHTTKRLKPNSTGYRSAGNCVIRNATNQPHTVKPNGCHFRAGPSRQRTLRGLRKEVEALRGESATEANSKAQPSAQFCLLVGEHFA